ncbi:hypothetical protein ACFQZ2_20805, partial [Streptomonospora algeriensis]
MDVHAEGARARAGDGAGGQGAVGGYGLAVERHGRHASSVGVAVDLRTVPGGGLEGFDLGYTAVH